MQLMFALNTSRSAVEEAGAVPGTRFTLLSDVLGG
jgi:hypothetical protein